MNVPPVEMPPPLLRMRLGGATALELVIWWTVRHNCHRRIVWWLLLPCVFDVFLELFPRLVETNPSRDSSSSIKAKKPSLLAWICLLISAPRCTVSPLGPWSRASSLWSRSFWYHRSVRPGLISKFLWAYPPTPTSVRVIASPPVCSLHYNVPCISLHIHR